MALRQKVLRKKAEKLQLKGLLGYKVALENTSELEEILHDVYAIYRPKPSEYDSRRDLVRVFNEIAKEIYGNSDVSPVVEEFGSFSMDLFSFQSDLDLSVNFRNNAVEVPRQKKIQTLRKFAKKFYALQRQGHVSGVHPVTTARVPILKVVDRGTGIECDISIGNRDGILKSQIVNMISSIDERFKKLSFLMKVWAKAQNINSSKDRTLNSISIVLLVAFHLQTRNPPILPAFSAIFKDGTDPGKVVKLLPNFLNYGKGNKESLAELFVTLLIMLSSVEKLWPKGLCASTYEGSWISKTWNSKVGCISVEDFTDRTQNVARAVGTGEVKKIHRCIQLSLQYVVVFMDGGIPRDKLREFLFGRDAIPTPVGTGNTSFNKNVTQPCILPEPIQIKRMRTRDGWAGTPEAMSFEPILMKGVQSAQGWGGMNTGNGGATPTEGWTGMQQTVPFDPNLTKTQSNKVWGGTSIESWGRTTAEGWERTQQPIANESIEIGKIQGAVGWAGMQQATSLGPLWTRGTSSTGGWGGMQEPNTDTSTNVNPLFNPSVPSFSFASSLGKPMSCASLEIPYVHGNTQVNFQTSGSSLLQSTYVPPRNPRGFGGSCSTNQVVPKPIKHRHA